MTKLEKMQSIADANGINVVKEKIKEECLELIEAINNNDDVNIIEEIADVSITMTQYLLKTDTVKEYNKQLDYKLDRTRQRLGLEKGDA